MMGIYLIVTILGNARVPTSCGFRKPQDVGADQLMELGVQGSLKVGEGSRVEVLVERSQDLNDYLNIWEEPGTALPLERYESLVPRRGAKWEIGGTETPTISLRR